ncbi:MAG: hypothetical protein NVS3B20_20350 [Polyangiales bacterium]
MGPKLLADALARNGVSQRDLERDLVVAKGLVSRWISGERCPGLDEAIAIRDRFGVSVDDWAAPRHTARHS